EEGGQALDAEHGGGAWVGVGIELADLDAAGVGGGEAVDAGGDRAAGATPGGPAVEDDRERRVKHLPRVSGVGEGDRARGSARLAAWGWLGCQRRFAAAADGAGTPERQAVLLTAARARDNDGFGIDGHSTGSIPR